MLTGRSRISGFPKSVLYFCILSLYVTHLSCSTTFTSQTNIHIGAFLPLSRNISQGSIGRGVVPAIKLAARHINSSPLILKDYRLVVQFYDTMCDAAVGMKAFFDMLHQKPHKLILFGAACTGVTDPIAKSSQFFQLAQITYADTHPMYTKENYPNFFRAVPSETAFNPARVALLKYYNWTRVGTLYQNSPRYDLPHSKLLTDLDSAQIMIAETQGLVEELQYELIKLKNKDVRIILGNFDEEWARRIFCEAYRLKMYGRKYQWIIVGMYQERWWEVRDQNSSCTPWELTQAMEGHIATDVLPLSSSENITVSGLTPAEYAGQYDKRRESEYSRFHGYAYDGIWAIALAIQSVAQKLKTKGKNLKEFQYRDPFWGQLFRDAFNETSFTGVTGPVHFIKNERRSQILLKQFQNGSEVKVGEYDPIFDEIDFSKGVPIIWSAGGGPPADRTHKKITKKRISITVYSILVTFAIFGIIIATVFLIVNIKYRNQRYIKMSSPYLNNIIVVGCMLTYTSVILLGMDSGLSSETNFPYVCTARAWVLMSGFTLAFGSMFSKTWRVHAIFTNIKLNKKIIKDYKLFMVVGVLVMIDVIILTTWQIIDPFYRKTTTGAPLPSPENEDIEIIPELEFCQSNNMTIFLGSIYAYKGLLMAFGCFLAWETRHVSIPALNDSKYIGMSVYNVVIMCVIGAALSFVLREQQDAAFIIISIFIMFCSTTTLCLVFVPKVRLLLELWSDDPRASEKRVRATLKPLKKSRRSSDEEDMQYSMQVLVDENRRFRQRYEDVSIELQKLNLRLREAEEPMILVTHGYDMTSPIVELPSLEVSEEESAEDTFTRRPSMPVRSQAISLPKRRMSEISVRISTMSERESSYVRTDESSVQMSSPPPTDEGTSFQFPSVPRVEEPKPSPSTSSVRYRQLQPLSLMDETGQAVKFVDSDSSEGSGKSPSARTQPEYQESDDTSYAKAIQNTQRKRSLMNGLSSSAEEDTDKFEMGTYSEADSDNNAIRPGSIRADVRRRAKSLGALRDAGRRTSYGTAGPQGVGQVSVIHNRRTDPGLLPLFPYISHIMNNRKSPNDDESTPLYSSYPSVKCDIVEYL
ncbi:gamma-aminobutyric acid type B receptor subunit 2-like isoform X1 [Argiope bruennichi]|uniref:gamma-aminobutyric acid type B receptor subunit 2-like isoform X1 n=1 Tax=Argiope bruennichi TaxID=94029 RepID=UPI0024957E3D|nr:gamma-aminobutyric acid type B receptor subunit 2-like isoform X1 [Argiope bruennichi]